MRAYLNAQIIDNDIGTDTYIHGYMYPLIYICVFQCFSFKMTCLHTHHTTAQARWQCDQGSTPGGWWCLTLQWTMHVIWIFIWCVNVHIYIVEIYIYMGMVMYMGCRACDVIWDWMMKMYYICWPSLFSVHFEARFDLLKLSWQWIPSGPVKDFTRDFDPTLTGRWFS